MADKNELEYVPFDDEWKWVPANQEGFLPIVAQAMVYGEENNMLVGGGIIGDEEVPILAAARPVGLGFFNERTGEVGVRPMPTNKGLHRQDLRVMPVEVFLNQVGDDDSTVLQESAIRWGGKKRTHSVTVYEFRGVEGLPKKENDLVVARGGNPSDVVDEDNREAMLRAARVSRFKQYQGGK